MLRTQPLPAEYLPPQDALPFVCYALPELSYPARLNLAEALLDGALERGFAERVAYYCDDQRLTYAELAGRVNRLANGLLSLGVGLGDRVLLRMYDGPELVCALLAVVRIGAIAVPTYPLFGPADLLYRLNDAEAVAAIVDADLSSALEEIRARCTHLRHVILAPHGGDSSAISYQELVSGQPDTCPAAPTGRDDVAILAYTSGTTGEPKGALQTHADHLASADVYRLYVGHLTPGDVLAGPPAIPFRFGTEFFVVYSLRTGSASLLFRRKTPAILLEAVERHRVTVFGGVPTFYNMALEELESGRRYDLSSLRLCVCAGEPMPEPMFERWLAATGIPLTQMLGTTELGWFLGYRPAAGTRPETLGMAFPGFHVVVRDPNTFEELPRNSQGVLTVVGPTGLRYWRKPDEQRRAVRRGWSVVPDFVSMDDESYVRHVARADDIIVSAGYNIPPAQVEAVLAQHPAVVEVACVAAPDSTGVRSAIVKAYVVLRAGWAGSDELQAELQRLVRERAAPYMYPREVEFLAELPKTPNGKVRRSELRAWGAARASTD